MSGCTKGEDRTRLDGVELEIFKLVRERATSEQWREWLRAPLEHAAAKGDMDLFARLMGAGADGSAGWRGCHGRTLLGAAAYGKSDKIVRALLQLGAKTDLDVKFGAKRESALHVATARGAAKTTYTLLLAGADPNALNGNQERPLHLAAEAGHHEVVINLLRKGALPDAKIRGVEQTPLHLAAAEGYGLCVSQLLQGGADTEPRDDNNETPLHLATKGNHVGTVEQLLAAGANVDVCGSSFYPSGWSLLDNAVTGRHVGVVRALLQHGSNVSSTDDEFNYTALHRAACCDGLLEDNGDIIRALITDGSDTEAKTPDCGSTPLHFAASEPIASSGTFCALLEGGANVNARDGLDATPLHDACSHSCVGAVEYLLRWGADERLINVHDETAEDLVGKWEHDGDQDSDEEERQVDDQRIRHMLARAPANRFWRRRGWLVLARSCPTKVQLAQDSKNGDGNSGSSTKTAKTSHGRDDRSGDETAGLARLVGRVVGLDEEGIFRLVVAFL